MKMYSFQLALSLLAVSLTGSEAQCSKPSFKQDASSMVEAGFMTTFKRGKETHDYKKIEIIYSPFLMVEVPDCIEEERLNLEIKSGNGDWVAMDSQPESLGGGKYRWTIDAVPCKDHFIKLWFIGPGGQSELTYPNPIPAASDEEITKSRFTPSKPTNIQYTSLGDNSVEVSWDPSDCATSYDISYGKILSNTQKFQTVPASQGSSIIISEGLEQCSEYELSIYAVVGEEYSEEAAATKFGTPPDASSASVLEPEVFSEVFSMTATWKGFDQLSCVNKYSVTVCKEKEDCQEEKELERNDALDYMKYETSELDHCSPYTLQIQPLYGEQRLPPKVVDFRTRSPPAEGISTSLDPVTAEAGDAQKIYVSWSPVQCAEHYEVYQKVNSAGGDWEIVMTTEETNIELNGVPCTEYKYGVLVSIDGIKSEIREVDGSVMTNLDNSVAFVAPNLLIDSLEDGALLSWDHGACISGYTVKACTTDGENICEEQEIMKDSTVHNISLEIHDLKSCTAYSLEILPIVPGSDFEADFTDFRTSFPAAAPPSNFSAVYMKDSNKVELSWSEVECASGYKIMQMIGNSETTTAWETDDPLELFKSLESPEPCVTYSYGVASVVGGLVSEPTAWEEFSIPPRHGVLHQPTLEVLEAVNDTVAIKIMPAAANMKCQVEVYEVRYTGLGGEEVEEEEVHPETLTAEETILLTFPGASSPSLNLEARIKYQDFQIYSPWIQSADPSIMLSDGNTGGNTILVPIIIGVLVALVVILISVFFLVKRKRSQNKYDAEKASADKDETQKLNENHPEA